MAKRIAYPKVEVGGHDVSDYVRSYRLEQRIGEPPTLTVEVWVGDPADLVEQTADTAVARIGEETRAALLALGWTPPGT